MEVIISQPYVNVVRSVEWNQQRYIEENKHLDLYENKMIAPNHEFNLDDVFDVSYRATTAVYGFLYLHTIEGVFAYLVKSHPNDFIEAYKELTKK